MGPTGETTGKEPVGEIRVLCVDDDELTADLNAEMLEDQDGEMTVTGLTDPSEVLPFLEREPVDCVVSDYDMPEMSGLELLEQVRERFPDLPFILFTGKGSEQIASDAISAGVTDYLRKGTGAERYELLHNRIRNCVSRTRERRRRMRAEDWYYQLFEQGLIGVGLSQDQVYQEANSLFADMLGYDREELIGMPVFETVASYDHDRVRRAIDRREGGKTDRVRYTLDLHCRDGTNRTADVIGSRVEYQGNPAVLGLILPVNKSIPQDSSRFESITQQLETVREALEPYSTDDEALEDAYVTATEAYEQLSDIVAGRFPDEDGVASVADAVRAAWERLEPPASASLDIAGDKEIRVRRHSLVDLVEQIFVVALDEVFEDCTVRCRTTDRGFVLHIISPHLKGTENRALVSSQHSPPDPVNEGYWQRGIDIYINRVAENAVEYELFVAETPQ
jgi:PAS domain S-box-containing protein